MKKAIIPALLVIANACLIGCAHSGRSSNIPDYDVLLKATPINMEVISAHTKVDAIEAYTDAAGEFRYSVSFRIEDVLSGEFSKVRQGGQTKLQQAKNAAADKKFFKLLTMDFYDPDEQVDKRWLRIAVFDPEKTFGLNPGIVEGAGSYKLYLQRMPESPDTYVMVYHKQL